jgi:hypothetical protein
MTSAWTACNTPSLRETEAIIGIAGRDLMNLTISQQKIMLLMS